MGSCQNGEDTAIPNSLLQECAVKEEGDLDQQYLDNVMRSLEDKEPAVMESLHPDNGWPGAC